MLTRSLRITISNRAALFAALARSLLPRGGRRKAAAPVFGDGDGRDTAEESRQDAKRTPCHV